MSFLFYDELSIIEMSKAFKGYERSYKIEIVYSKDPLAQLEASKLSIEVCLKTLYMKRKALNTK